MPKFKILISGAFGYGNLGDDILRDTLTELLYDRYENIEVYVDRPYPDKNLINKCDLKIIGPGGLLYDIDKTHIEYYMQYLISPYVLIGTGIQYPEVIENNGLIINAIKGADLILSRELNDSTIFSKIDNVLQKVEYIPDLAFFNKDFKRTHVPFCKKTPHITFCVNIDELSEDFKDKLFDSSNRALINSILSFHTNDDNFVDELRKKVGANRTTIDFYYSTIPQAYNVIANSDLLVTGRFHAAIMAIYAGIKVVGIPTKENKLKYKLDAIGIEEVNFDKMQNNIFEYIDNIKEIDKINNYSIEDIRNKIFDPLKRLDEYLEKKFNIKKRV